MNEKAQKKLLCIALAVIFAFNTIYTSGEVAYAAGLSSAELVSQDTESGSGVTDPPLEETGQGLQGSDAESDGMESGDMESEGSVTEDGDAVQDTEQGDTGIKPGISEEDKADGSLTDGPEADQGQGSVENDKIQNDDSKDPSESGKNDAPANGSNITGPEEDSSDQGIAGDKPEGADTAESGKDAAGENADKEQSGENQEEKADQIQLSDHTLAQVYWNPGSGETDSMDNPGSDKNTGASYTEPVKSFETALSRASQGAVIYCMDEFSVQDNYVIDGKELGISLKTWPENEKSLFRVKEGSLTLSNVKLEGEEKQPAIVLEKNGELVFGENVQLRDSARILIKNPGTPLKLTKKPAEDWKCQITLDQEAVQKQLADEKVGEKGLCIFDARAAGAAPIKYVALDQTPEGAEVYEQENCLWLRQTKVQQRAAAYAVPDIGVQPRDVRGSIYLSSIGNDGNDGLTAATAVQTFPKAKALIKEKFDMGIACDIVMCNTIQVAGTEIWELPSGEFPWSPRLLRDPGNMSALISVQGKLTLKDITIDGNNIPCDLGAVILGGELVLESGASIVGNNAIKNLVYIGGAIMVSQHEAGVHRVVMNGGEITGNSSNHGGAIGFGDGGELIMNAGSISGNTAIIEGGGVWGGGSYAEPLNIVLNGGEISGNYSENGGGIYLSQNGASGSSILTIEGGSIKDNVAGESAGGIYMNSGKMELIRGEITGNTCGIWGGGMYLAGTGFHMQGGRISGNSAVSAGGGFSLTSEGSAGTSGFVMEGGEISGNSSVTGGGAYIQQNISRTGELVTIKDGKICGNTATVGGGIQASMGRTTLNIQGGEITDNTAEEGAGIMCTGGGGNPGMFMNLILGGGIIQGNKASGGDGIGGGIYLYSTEFTMQGGDISQNEAEKGGAIGLAPDRVKIRLHGGKVHDNQAQQGAGMFIRMDHGIDVPFLELAVNGGSITQGITINDIPSTSDVFPLKLIEPVNTDKMIELELTGNNAGAGTKVVIPDGTNVTDAGDFLSSFRLISRGEFVLGADSNNIVLVQGYFVDGEHGEDANDGKSPVTAFKTIEKALQKLGTDAGNVSVCGTVTVSGTESWTMEPGQSVQRFMGGNVDGNSYPAFTGTMIKVEDTGALNLESAVIYGNGSQNTEAGYLLDQNGSLSVSTDSSLQDGTVLLRDGKHVGVSGNRNTRLLMQIEKENPAAGDVIGSYANTLAPEPQNFSLVSSLRTYHLEKAGDKIILEGGPDVYVDGQNGDDTMGGNRSHEPVKTMKRAYEVIQQYGGTIHVIDTVETAKEMKLSDSKYEDENGAVTIADGTVEIKRYPSNSKALFRVLGDTLTLSAIKVDGLGANAADVQGALIMVEEQGTLRLKDGAKLVNNFTSAAGGAVENMGTLELYECMITENQAALGTGIYQGGTLFISGNSVLAGNNIYLEAEHHINVNTPLAAGSRYVVELGDADTSAGRTIVIFSNGAFHEGKVIDEAEHFSVLSSGTARTLAAKGADNLVLSSGFAVSLDRMHILGKMGEHMQVQAEVENAPDEVSVTAKLGERQIPIDIAEIQDGKEIQIPIERGNIGEISLMFSSGAETAVVKLTVSGYEVSYPNGQNSLEAKAQADGVQGAHRDKAHITVYNGSARVQSFSIGGTDASYEDGSEITIDNNRVFADMQKDLAMTCFGMEIDAKTVIASGSVMEFNVSLVNGDHLTEQKSGCITLKDVRLGDAKTVISLNFVTRPVTRVQAAVRKDGTSYESCKLWLMDEAGAKTELSVQGIKEKVRVLSASKKELWPYRVTGLAPGSYRLYADGIDTGRSVSVAAGSIKEESLDFYSIQMELNGGTLAEQPGSYLKGVGLTLPEPMRKDCLFDGWYADKAFAGNAVKEIGSSAEGTYHLYAKWLTKDGGQIVGPEEPKPGQPDKGGTEEPGGQEPGTDTPEDETDKNEPGRDRTPLLERILRAEGVPAPRTGDKNVILIDIALIGGMAYLMRLFAKQAEGAGMSEEQKDTMMENIIRKARGKNYLVRVCALITIGIVLLYYYTMGMKEDVKEEMKALRS